MTQMFLRLRNVVQTFINLIFLTLIYGFGIGLTAVAAQGFGKRFLKTKPKKTTWKPYRSTQSIERMY